MASFSIQHPMLQYENATRRILRAVWQAQRITKLELQQSLGLSHPTVLAGVNRLLELGIVRMEQAQGDTMRGRKPAAVTFIDDARLAVGADVGVQTVRLVLTDLRSNILAREAFPGPGSEAALHTPAFLHQLNDRINQFVVAQRVPVEKLLELGLCLPGQFSDGVWRCGGESSNLDDLAHLFTLPTLFRSESDAAPLSEIWNSGKSHCAVLGLNDTLTCYAVCQGFPVNGGYRPLDADTPPVPGSVNAIGHLTLYPGGRPCACGRHGCANQYCAAGALLDAAHPTLAAFFQALEGGDKTCIGRFDAYLDALALLLCHVDMQYGSEIVLSGTVAEFLAPHLPALRERMRAQMGAGNAPSGPLTLGKLRSWAVAVNAAIISVAYFFDSDYFGV